MRATTVTELRKNLATELDAVVDDRETLIVTRSGGKGAVVVMSLEEYGSWEATNHLLKSPENARRLRESIAQYGAGKLVEYKLVDPDE